MYELMKSKNVSDIKIYYKYVLETLSLCSPTSQGAVISSEVHHMWPVITVMISKVNLLL